MKTPIIVKNLAIEAKANAHLPENTPDYKSLKQYSKEHLAEEKGSAARGLLYAIPGALAGGIGAYYLGGKLRPMAKNMPAIVQKHLRKILDKTNPTKYLKPSIMDNPIIDKILAKAPDISKQEMYEEMIRYISDPRLRLGIAGSIVGGGVGAQIGDVNGGKKSLNKAEVKSGYKPSTNMQYAGRVAAGAAGGGLGSLAGVAAGAGIAKAIPDIKGKGTLPMAANAGKFVASYIAPTIIMENLGAGAGKYLASRYLQQHKPLEIINENKS